MKRIKQTFEIETSPEVMERIERFFALLHHNSNFGHSATFGMWLDGDGSDKVSVSPKPRYAKEVDLIGGVGGSIEIAGNNCYTCCDTKKLASDWYVMTTGSLYKNGDLHSTYPRTSKEL